MQFEFPESEPIQARPLKKGQLPKKVLIIRFHAFGDVLVGLAAAQALHDLHPSVELQVLTCSASAELASNMSIFSKVHVLKHSRGGWPMALDLLKKNPKLLFERFDAVIDLQNNRLSRIMRKSLFPTAWTQFDRYSRIHVLQRYENTINALGIGQVEALGKITLHDETRGTEKLKEKGWNGEDRLILLNPCGAFSTRQWTAERYLGFAQMWLSEVDPQAKFVLLGYPALLEKTETLVQALGTSCINLIGETSTMDAFNIVRRVNLTLSDDGALLHASWVNHVPTIAFLGASPSYWGRPLGPKSFGFTSEDLPCGNCHRTVCKWGDNRCLTRVTVEQSVEQARILLGS